MPTAVQRDASCPTPTEPSVAPAPGASALHLPTASACSPEKTGIPLQRRFRLPTLVFVPLCALVSARETIDDGPNPWADPCAPRVRVDPLAPKLRENLAPTANAASGFWSSAFMASCSAQPSRHGSHAANLATSLRPSPTHEHRISPTYRSRNGLSDSRLHGLSLPSPRTRVQATACRLAVKTTQSRPRVAATAPLGSRIAICVKLILRPRLMLAPSPYDIMLFAETDMLPGEKNAANLPCGYSLISLPRKTHLQTNRRGGVVALLIRDNIEFTKSYLSSPDILVLDLGFMRLIGACIIPVTSRWECWTDVVPFQQFWETVAVCSQNEANGTRTVLSFSEPKSRRQNDDLYHRTGSAIFNAATLETVFGHSYCIGGSVELLLAGVDPEVIMKLGGWTFLCFLIYWHRLEILPNRITGAWDARIKQVASAHGHPYDSSSLAFDND
ncbi:hypothetical protein DFH07DRAFT_951837 [Mycena maculata]|uniref:Uncharacterized protein n=1 Tax=Mycena maculata TaxID=230809 RepID=A0AAD7NUS6_9AGAR|nr:hypothetical protein DFH07DRAFT_951837 [Mycena maculata]